MMTGLVGVTGEPEEEDVEELSQDIVENEGLEDKFDGVVCDSKSRVLQVPVSLRVR